MVRRTRRLALTAGLGLALLSGALPCARAQDRAQAPAQEPLRWQAPVAYASTLVGLGDTMLWVADQLRAVSGGAIDLQVAEPGAAAAPTGIFEAVASGAVKAGHSWMGFEAETVPAAPLFGGAPFGLGPVDFLAWMEFRGGRDLLERIYRRHGVRPIPCGTAPAEAAGWFRAPLSGPADLEGLRIRTRGLGAEALAALGAEPVVTPGGALVRALAEGEVDAAEFSLPSVDAQLGLDLAAPVLHLPGWQQPATNQFLYVNLAAWEGLAEPTRALIELVCRAAGARALAAAEAVQGAALAAFAESGVAVEPLPPAALEALREAAAEVMQRHAAADPDFARVFASMNAFQQEIAPWKALGALPPEVAATD